MPDTARKTFTNSVLPLPADGAGEHGLVVQSALPVTAEHRLRLHFSLNIDPELQTELESRVAKGERISADELNSRFSGGASSTRPLVDWLTQQGYTGIKETPDHLSVYAEGSVKQIQDSMQVSFTNVMRDGITYISASSAPSLPADIGEPVQAIAGLQPFRHANKHRVQHAAAAQVAQAAPGASFTPPYKIADIRKAYNADTVTATGRGQVIGILIDTFPDDADVTAFWNACGIPANLGRIQKINVSGGTPAPPEGEESLDVEWSSGIAQEAVIRVYATGSLSWVDIDAALDQILADAPNTPGFNQLSISLGLGELYVGPVTGEPSTEDKKFVRLAALGVNVFVSSGDAGSRPDTSGHSATGPTQAEFSSSDPWVIGVGGTSLTMDSSGNVTQEIGWAAGGGGRSVLFPRPTWQTATGVPDGTDRLVPDVSVAADPNTGCLLVVGGVPQQIGGTSWSAPTWAGFCAVINDARSRAGKPPLGFLNPIIYPLGGTAAFRDITQGSNGDYSAGPGYDMVTGLGVPDVGQLIALLP